MNRLNNPLPVSAKKLYNCQRISKPNLCLVIVSEVRFYLGKTASAVKISIKATFVVDFNINKGVSLNPN